MLSMAKEAVGFVCALVYSIFLPLLVEPYRVVIYYHGVQTLDICSFRKQIRYLAEKCCVVKPSKITTARVAQKSPVVAITFDDAFVSVIENAVPILKELALPVGIFVPVGNLGQKPDWEMPDNCSDKNEVVINEDQIKQLDKDGFEVFSHTVSHSVLTELEDSKLDAELTNSKRALEKMVGHEVCAISYPHGAYDVRVHNAVRKAGYRLGFTIKPEMVTRDTNDLMIGRFKVLPNDGLIRFKLKVNGAYRILKHLQAMKKFLIRFSLKK